MLLQSLSETQSFLTVFHPQTSDEITVILQSLLNRQAILVNLSRLHPSQSQKFIDWVAGSTDAIDGQTIWIGELTFLFVPSNIKVIANFKDKYLPSFNQNLNQIKEKNKFLDRARKTGHKCLKKLQLFPLPHSA